MIDVEIYSYRESIMSDLKGFHYDAFISYRHSDIDSFVAQNLHKKLENFKLPKSVLPKVQNGKKKIERIFRDVDELPLSEDLSDPISKALQNSDYLITICTPRYPQSRWCMKEIEVFLQTHPRDHILVVLAEDEPDNSFPEILCYEDVKITDENGQIHVTRREIEPLAADTRGSNKKEMLKAMDIAVIKLCAAMFGLNYDDLKQRHREQKIRRLTAIFGSIGVAVLAFAIFATVMLIKISKQNVIITDQYNELQDSFAQAMAGVSDNLLTDGRRKDAAYAVRNVIPDDGEGKYNVNAVKALYNAMEVYKLSPIYSPSCTYDADSWLYYFGVSCDQKYVFVNSGSKVYICDHDSGEVLDIIENDEGDTLSSAFCGNDGVIITDGEDAFYYSIGNKEKTDIELPEYSILYPADDGSMVVANSLDSLCGIGSTGDVIFETELASYFGDAYTSLTGISFEKDYVVCTFWSGEEMEVLFINPSNGEIEDSYTKSSDSEPCAKLSDDTLYTVTSNHDEDTGEWDADIVATNISKDKKIWKLTLEDLELTGGRFFSSDDYLFFQSVSEVIVIDLEEGNLLKRYPYSQMILESWLKDDPDYGPLLYYVLTDGSVFCCNENFQSEQTDTFYTKAPKEKITQATYSGSNLYFVLGYESYAIRYSKEITPSATAFDEDLDWDQAVDLLPEDVFDDDKYDINFTQVDHVYYSDDKNYIFAIFSDHTAKIYDATTCECVNSFETTLEMADIFRYSDLTGSYIISGSDGGDNKSFILDTNMQIICETDFIISEEGNDFIMMSDDIEYYKVPYIDINTLLEMSDEYLKDYKPPVSIRDKYGIS